MKEAVLTTDPDIHAALESAGCDLVIYAQERRGRWCYEVLSQYSATGEALYRDLADSEIEELTRIDVICDKAVIHARRLGLDRCWIPKKWNEGAKGYALGGYGSVPAILADMVQAPIDGLYSQGEASPKIWDYYENGQPKGWTCGLENLDEHYTPRLGEFTLITGIPGHGKSEFADQVLTLLADKHNLKFAIYSPENSPAEMHTIKLAEKYSGLPFEDSQFNKKMGKKQLEDSLAWLDAHFYRMEPVEDCSLDQILYLAKCAVIRHDVNGVLIDPWNEVEHKRPENQTETEYISESLTKIRRFSRKHNVHIWLVVHPRKMEKDKQTNDYAVPTPYDISGSAHWRNKADNCLSVYRLFDKGQGQPDPDVQVHIQKIRFKVCGKVGIVNFSYNRLNGRYIPRGL